MLSPQTPLSRILYCTDFSDNAYAAFDQAVAIASAWPGCELTLLHVLPEPDAQFWKTYIYEGGDVDEKAKAALDQAIDRDYRPKVPAGVTLKTAFRIGKPASQALELAQELKAQLIVVGRSGAGSISNLLFGSVAAKIVQKAACPVLVIPMPDKG